MKTPTLQTAQAGLKRKRPDCLAEDCANHNTASILNRLQPISSSKLYADKLTGNATVMGRIHADRLAAVEVAAAPTDSPDTTNGHSKRTRLQSHRMSNEQPTVPLAARLSGLAPLPASDADDAATVPSKRARIQSHMMADGQHVIPLTERLSGGTDLQTQAKDRSVAERLSYSKSSALQQSVQDHTAAVPTRQPIPRSVALSSAGLCIYGSVAARLSLPAGLRQVQPTRGGRSSDMGTTRLTGRLGTCKQVGVGADSSGPLTLTLKGRLHADNLRSPPLTQNGKMHADRFQPTTSTHNGKMHADRMLQVGQHKSRQWKRKGQELPSNGKHRIANDSSSSGSSTDSGSASSTDDTSDNTADAETAHAIGGDTALLPPTPSGCSGVGLHADRHGNLQARLAGPSPLKSGLAVAERSTRSHGRMYSDTAAGGVALPMMKQLPSGLAARLGS